MAFLRTCVPKQRGEAITDLWRSRRPVAAGSGSGSREAPRHSVARLNRGSRAVGTVSVNRNGRRQEVMQRDPAVFSRSPATVVLLHRLITAVTINLARSVRTSQPAGHPRVRPDTAAPTTMALVQTVPHQI